MAPTHGLWRAVRWPLVVLLAGTMGVTAATILDQVYSSEWSLTIGAPALSLVLPFGVVWLVIAVVAHVKHKPGM